MFQRGFKAWCENVALQARREFGLKPFEPIDLSALVAHVGATVLYPEQIPGLSSDALDTLLNKDPDGWSAVTLTLKPNPIIILNSVHSPARRTSSLAHELAHILIGHAPSQTGISPDGLLLSAHDRQQEDEANWLAGCLLLPRPACLFISKQRLDQPTAMRRYGVSREMLQYRLNTSGVKKQIGAWLHQSGATTRA